MTNIHCDNPDLIPLEDALKSILQSAMPIQRSETVDIISANRRVAAEPLIARHDSPAFDTSMMDGYAVNSNDFKDSKELIISQRVAAGDSPTPLMTQTAARVFTGAPIPAGADTVVIQEECVENNNKIRLPDEIIAGKNILLRGENIRANEVIFEQGSYLQPYHLGLAASQGLSSLEVYSKLSIALINTGNELVMPGSELGPGQIYNSNYFTIRSMLEGIGCKTLSFNIVKDTLDETKATLAEAANKADAILSTGESLSAMKIMSVMQSNL